MKDIIDFFRQLLESEQFMPRWVCGQWTPFHGWMYVISDLTIFLAYMAIPFALVYFVRKRWNDLPFKWVFYMFVAFITLCGLTHFIDAIIFWIPVYRLNAIALMTTAVVSVITVIGMLKIIPQALTLKGPEELRAVVEQKTLELADLNRNLERIVRDRTAELEEVQSLTKVASWNLDWKTGSIEWSRELFLMFGEDPETYRPQYDSIIKRIPASTRSTVEAAVENCVATGQPFDIMHEVVHPSLGVKQVRARGKAIYEKGEVVRMIGTTQDITQDVQAQKMIVESELLMRSLLKSTTDAIIVSNAKGEVIKWNEAAEAIFGWDADEMAGRPMETVLAEKHRESLRLIRQRYIETGNAKAVGQTIETEGVRKDGSSFPVEISSGAWQVDGEHFFCGIIRDITERKQAERELIKLKNDLEERGLSQLAAIVQSSEDSIIALGLDGTILSWNKGAVKLFGYSRDQIVGKNVRELYLEKNHNDLKNVLQEIGKGQTVRHLEAERVRKDGTIIHVSITKSPIFDADNNVTGISAIARDITEKRTAELEEKRLLRELRRANQELENFAYIASHDLKAPLRAIGSLADWIYADYADKMEEDGREHLNLLKARVQRMHDLIEGILQYSRVGRKDGEVADLDLNLVVADVLSFIGIPEHVNVTVAKGLPTVKMYRAHPTQIFENLISNAIKYGNEENGVVEVGFEELPDHYRFFVKDNGVGIDEKYHEKVFEIFQTLNARDEFESTGIGLTIVKKIVENVGGEVWLESELGKGTTFYFTLPKS